MVQFNFPNIERFGVAAAQHKCTIVPFQLESYAIILVREDLMNAYLVEIDDTFRGLLIQVVLLRLIILQHSTREDEVSRLKPVEELTRPLLLHDALVEIVLRQLIVDD